MKYRDLGRTGVKVSALCLGGGNFGKPDVDANLTESIINHALDRGVNFIDTANSYGGVGKSEAYIGQALQRNKKRKNIVLATKFSNPISSDDPNGRGTSRRHIIECCEDSLRRLQTDYIDLYYIHKPHPQTPIDEALRALDDLIRSGKVRYIGTSSFTAWEVIESLWVAKELGLNRVIAEQPPYNMLDRCIERDLVPFAQTYGLAINPWSPMARGLLAGVFNRGERPTPAELNKTTWVGMDWWDDLHFSDEVFDIVDVVRLLADEKGCTPAQVTLAWVMQQPGITSPIIGPRTIDHLDENLGALDIEITDNDRQRIDAVTTFSGSGDVVRVVVPYRMRFEPHPYGW